MASNSASRRAGIYGVNDLYNNAPKPTTAQQDTESRSSSGSSNSGVSQLSQTYDDKRRKFTPVYRDFRDARANILHKNTDVVNNTRQFSGAPRQTSGIPFKLATIVNNNSDDCKENIAPFESLPNGSPHFGFRESSPLEFGSSSTPERVRELGSGVTISPPDNSFHDVEQWPATNPYSPLSPTASMSPIFQVSATPLAGSGSMLMTGFTLSERPSFRAMGGIFSTSSNAAVEVDNIDSYYADEGTARYYEDYTQLPQPEQYSGTGAGHYGQGQGDFAFRQLLGLQQQPQSINSWQSVSSPVTNGTVDNFIDQYAEENSRIGSADEYEDGGELTRAQKNTRVAEPLPVELEIGRGAPFAVLTNYHHLSRQGTCRSEPEHRGLSFTSLPELQDYKYLHERRSASSPERRTIEPPNGFASPYQHLFLPNYDSSDSSIPQRPFPPTFNSSLGKLEREEWEAQYGPLPPKSDEGSYEEDGEESARAPQPRSYNEYSNNSSAFFDPTPTLEKSGRASLEDAAGQDISAEGTSYSPDEDDLGHYRLSQQSLIQPVLNVARQRQRGEGNSTSSGRNSVMSGRSISDPVRLSVIAKNGLMPAAMTSGHFYPLENGAIVNLRMRSATGETRYGPGNAGHLDTVQEHFQLGLPHAGSWNSQNSIQSESRFTVLQRQASDKSQNSAHSGRRITASGEDWETTDERSMQRPYSGGFRLGYTAPLGHLGQVTGESIADYSDGPSQVEDTTYENVLIHPYLSHDQVLVHPAQMGQSYDRFPRILPNGGGMVLLPSHGQGQGAMPRDAHRVGPRVVPRSVSVLFSPRRHQRQEYIELDDMPEQRGMPPRQKSRLSIVTNMEGDLNSSSVDAPTSPVIIKRPAKTKMKPDLWGAAQEGIPNKRAYKQPYVESVQDDHSSSDVESSPVQTTYKNEYPLYSRKNEQFVNKQYVFEHRPRYDMRRSFANDELSRASTSSNRRPPSSYGVRSSVMFAGPNRQIHDFIERKLPKQKSRRKAHNKTDIGGRALPRANPKAARNEALNGTSRSYKLSIMAAVSAKRYGDLNVRPLSMLTKARQASAQHARERRPRQVMQIVPGQLSALRREMTIRHYSGVSDANVFVSQPRSQEAFQFRDPCAPLRDMAWKRLYGRRTWNLITDTWKSRLNDTTVLTMSRMDGYGNINMADAWRVEPVSPVLPDDAERFAQPHAEETLFSIIVLVICCIVAPLAPVYGWRRMDGLMRWYSRGEISSFGHRERQVAKLATLFWGLVVIIGIAIILALKAMERI